MTFLSGFFLIYLAMYVLYSNLEDGLHYRNFVMNPQSIQYNMYVYCGVLLLTGVLLEQITCLLSKYQDIL